MSNVCTTQFAFRGAADEILDFHDKLVGWTSPPNISENPNCRYDSILKRVGLEDHVLSNNSGSIHCGASIMDISDICTADGESQFSVYVESAWVPMAKMWVALIDRLGYKTIVFAYLAEECGEDIYQLYNPHNIPLYAEPYYITGYLAEEPPEFYERIKSLGWDCESDTYFESQESLIAFLQVVLDTTETDYDKLVDLLYDHEFSNANSFLSIHELDLVQDLYD